MVNLLVVAALLGSSLAYTFNVSNFQFLCMKQDGGYIPIANAAVNAMHAEPFKTWGKSGDVQSGNHFTDGNGMLFGLQKSIPQERTNETGDHFQLWIDIECNTYRWECPAVENLCQFSAHRYITLAMVYGGQEHKFQGGAYALITPRLPLVVANRAELPTAKMTFNQFCESPKGIEEVRECHWRSDGKKRSRNIDNGAATAGFLALSALVAKALF